MRFGTVSAKSLYISDVLAAVAVVVTPMANVRLTWRENLTEVSLMLGRLQRIISFPRVNQQISAP